MPRIGVESRNANLSPDGELGGVRERSDATAERPRAEGLDRERGTDLQRSRDAQQPDRVRVGGFGTPLMNGAGRVEFRWKPGSTIRFGAGLDLTSLGVSTPPRNVKVELWTNADTDDPTKFRGVPMQSTPSSDHHPLAFKIDLPVDRAGTYRATVRVSVDGGPWKYGNDIGASDITFRTRPIAFEKMNVRQVMIGMANNAPEDHKFSTIEDMLSNKWGKYNLEALAGQGVDTLYIECPFRADPWDGRWPGDDAGSPFAVTDFFAIDPRVSREAREVPNWDRDRQMQLANAAMKKLTDKAHSLGMKVLFGVAPNHVGHNYTFRDMFEDPDKGLQVYRNNFSQIAVRPQQLEHVERMLSSPTVKQHEKDYAEYLFPWLYARRDANPDGANHVTETMSEWWYGDWSDIKKLNHGGFMAYGISQARSEQNQKVLDWTARWMAHAVIALGADGFRIDHGTGMPDQFFQETLTRTQRIVDKHKGHHDPIFMMAEDHDRKQWIGNHVDYIQSKWWEQCIHATKVGSPDEFFGVFSNPYFNEILQSDNHDEVRGESHFDGDLNAYGRFAITTMFAGGPFSMFMGSEYGEGQKIAFKVGGGVPTLWQARQGKLQDASINLHKWLSKAGHIKTKHPAMQTKLMSRLEQASGDNRIIAFTKHPDEAKDNRVFVFSNLANLDWQTGWFKIDQSTRQWLHARNEASNWNAKFQVRNLLSDDPQKHLWSEPKSAGDLINSGLFAQLRPYEIQALELIQV